MTAKPDDRSLAAGAAPPLALRMGGPWTRLRHGSGLQLLLTLLILLAALLLGLAWLALPVALLTVALALRQLLPPLWQLLARTLEDPPNVRLVATLSLVLALLSIPLALGWLDPILAIYRNGVHIVRCQSVARGPGLECLAIVARDAAVGGKPQMTVGILGNIEDIVVRKTVFFGKTLKGLAVVTAQPLVA